MIEAMKSGGESNERYTPEETRKASRAILRWPDIAELVQLKQ